MTDFSLLDTHQYMNLTTFRRNGEGVTTPVWFALVDGKVYVITAERAYKLKRLAHTSRVVIGPSDGRGVPKGDATVEAEAHLVAVESDEGQAGFGALKRKYGIQWWLLRMMRPNNPSRIIVIE